MRLPAQESLFSHQNAVHGHVLRSPQCHQTRYTAQNRHNDPNLPQTIDVAVDKLGLCETAGHFPDDLDERIRLFRIFRRIPSQKRERKHLLPHSVLEDGTTDGHTDGLAKIAQEDVHVHSPGHVIGARRGLNGDGKRGEENAGPNARDKVEEDP